MKVLITGASGFLGGHLAEGFVRAGHSVRALVRPTSRTDLLERLGVELARGDLKDADSLRAAVEGVEVVVNAAATIDAPPQEHEAATTQGTRNLLSIAEIAGVQRFIHISSVEVYAVSSLPPGATVTEESALEDDPRFLSDYLVSKIESERAAQEFAAHERMKVVVLRLGFLYGPRGRWALPRMGYVAGRNRVIAIGRGRDPLPVCYVENAADAILHAAQLPAAPSGVFNILDDDPFTPIEYLRRIQQEVRPRLRVRRVPYSVAYALAAMGEGLARRLNLPFPFQKAQVILCHRRPPYSAERARQALGWRPVIGKTEALARTMQALAERESLSRRANLDLLRRVQVMRPPVGVAIIGCGGTAEVHLRILDQIPGIRVLGVCDPDAKAARRVARQFMVLHTYTDVHEMLEKEKPQVVHILTPPQWHAVLTEIAATHGAHILVEKPMAVTAKEARFMAEIAGKCGVRLCVDHNLLYDPPVVQARRLIESGDLGEVIWVESYYGLDLAHTPGNRYLLPGGERHWAFQLPGGLYQTVAAHPLSLALDMLGKPARVQAHARYGRVLPYATTDELRILLETPRASGLAVVSLAASPRFQYLNIYGTQMALFIDLLNKWVLVQRTARGVPQPVAQTVRAFRQGSSILRGTLSEMFRFFRRNWTYYDGMELLVKDFYSALQENRPPPVPGEEGILTMDVMDEVWQQIKAPPGWPRATEDR